MPHERCNCLRFGQFWRVERVSRTQGPEPRSVPAVAVAAGGEAALSNRLRRRHPQLPAAMTGARYCNRFQHDILESAEMAVDGFCSLGITIRAWLPPELTTKMQPPVFEGFLRRLVGGTPEGPAQSPA